MRISSFRLTVTAPPTECISRKGDLCIWLAEKEEEEGFFFFFFKCRESLVERQWGEWPGWVGWVEMSFVPLPV